MMGRVYNLEHRAMLENFPFMFHTFWYNCGAWVNVSCKFDDFLNYFGKSCKFSCNVDHFWLMLLVFGPLWTTDGPFWSTLDDFRTTFEHHWGHFGAPWNQDERSWQTKLKKSVFGKCMECARSIWTYVYWCFIDSSKMCKVWTNHVC